MDKKIERIIELSDCKWIRNRWNPKGNDLVKFRKSDTIVTLGVAWYFLKSTPNFEIVFPQDLYTNDIKAVTKTKEEMIWLPVNVNTETGNLQIDELLMEKLDVGYYPDIRTAFFYWYQNYKWNDHCYA